MAALNQTARLHVRAPKVGEGAQIASLWRELWEAHESWGGYPGSRDDRVYAHLGSRLDDDARVRAGNPVLGRHIHLIADLGGGPCAQVEGWLDQHGGQVATPITCEVRSLIVSSQERRAGVGRILLKALGAVARALAGRSPCVLAAEVLEPNPAQAFYARLGYVPVAWCARLPALSDPVRPLSSITARLATPEDATAIACLEAILASRRRDAGDMRFDGPRAIDPQLIAAIVANLESDAGEPARDPETIVAVDGAGAVRGMASFTAHGLESPFLPVRRALVGRFALDPDWAADPLVAELVGLGRRLAVLQRAQYVELTDLSAPGTDLYDAILSTGAATWSRIVTHGPLRV
jgi:GNAT superfamily N-acetyltransferase